MIPAAAFVAASADWIQIDILCAVGRSPNLCVSVRICIITLSVLILSQFTARAAAIYVVDLSLAATGT